MLWRPPAAAAPQPSPPAATAAAAPTHFPVAAAPSPPAPDQATHQQAQRPAPLAPTARWRSPAAAVPRWWSATLAAAVMRCRARKVPIRPPSYHLYARRCWLRARSRFCSQEAHLRMRQMRLLHRRCQARAPAQTLQPPRPALARVRCTVGAPPSGIASASSIPPGGGSIAAAAAPPPLACAKASRRHASIWSRTGCRCQQLSRRERQRCASSSRPLSPLASACMASAATGLTS